MVDRILNADRDAALDGLVYAAEVTPERHAELFRFEIPASGFDAGFRHSVTAGLLHQIPDAGGVFDVFPDHHRGEDLLRRYPSGIGPLIRISRPLAAGDLAPTLSPIGIFDADENDAAFVGATETG